MSPENRRKAFLCEMVVGGQNFRDPQAAHRRHRYAVHQAIALVISLLIQPQARQKGFTRLRLHRYTPIIQDLTDRLSGRLPQLRAALGKAVQKFRQHFVRRDQADISPRLAGVDYLLAVLIVRVQYRTPVERVRKNRPHFFFGAPCR